MKAVFDVTVNSASIRTVPKLDDELAAKIRPGLDAEAVRAEVCEPNEFSSSSDMLF